MYAQLKQNLVGQFAHLQDAQPIYQDFRAGDVLHSLADIGKAREKLDYTPSHQITHGLAVAMQWYVSSLHENKAL